MKMNAREYAKLQREFVEIRLQLDDSSLSDAAYAKLSKRSDKLAKILDDYEESKRA